MALSPDNKQFLDEIVAGGWFPSYEAALDAAVEALREKSEHIPTVPEEHAALVDEGLADLEAGRFEIVDEKFWGRMHKHAEDVANDRPGGE